MNNMTKTLIAALMAGALAAPTPAAAQALRSARVQTPVAPGIGAAAASVTPTLSAPNLSAPGLTSALPTINSAPRLTPITASAAAPMASPTLIVTPVARTAAMNSPEAAPAAKTFEAAASPLREVLSSMPEAAKAAPGASHSAGVSLENALTGRRTAASAPAVLPAAPTTLRGSLLAKPNAAVSAVGTEDWVPLALQTQKGRKQGAAAVAAAATMDFLSTPAGRWAMIGLGTAVALLAMQAYLPAVAASLSMLLMSGTIASTPAPQPQEDPQLAAEVKQVSGLLQKLREEVGSVIVGQKEMVDSIILAMIANEHILLEGVPGVAKTTTVEAFAGATGADWQVIQGTPDKMPADILGTEIIQTDQATGQRSTKLEKGPIFAQFVLADEINRMMPKTQAALLQAMQSRKVSIGRETLPLPKPFLLLATMNPLEQEGVNVMPEAQLDRFMFKVIVPQPDREERKRINDLNRKREKKAVEKSVTLEELAQATALAERVTMSEGVRDYIQDILDAAQDPFKFGIGQKGLVEQAMVTRASIMMEKAARIQALMQGRSYVTADDVAAVAPRILRHRIILSYAAGEMKTDQLIAEILATVHWASR